MISEKAKLYKKVDILRKRFLPSMKAPINTISFIENFLTVDIEYKRFNNHGLCGVAMVGEKMDMIILNENRDKLEQNFDCSHELMHLYLHRRMQDSFNCFTVTKPNQDSFLEWQANEGAAQWLVPYQDFIPRFISYMGTSFGPYGIQEILADYYQTTSQVIRNRINSLSYEIDQYRVGIPLNKITILSKRQLENKGIHPTSYNALCDFPLSWNATIG